ncbi:MAG: hypothetical protein HDS82_02470 [Bacteroidales bacterium]|nr:hypothetical protein [Bacteroidales bacterium]
MDFEKQTLGDLHRFLASIGKMDKVMAETADIQDLWPGVLEAYLPDGVREFEKYPVVSLGWIMFVGMAMAKYWDTDWEKYAKEGGAAIYTRLRDAKGYDNMDEYILKEVLGLDEKQEEEASKIVGECASRTLSALHRANIEAGTEAAANAYIGGLRALYTAGAAMELNALGYHMQAMG